MQVSLQYAADYMLIQVILQSHLSHITAPFAKGYEKRESFHKLSPTQR